MKVGNVTHAVVLSLVGIGAVGFLFMQIKSRMSRPVPVQTASRTLPANTGVKLPEGLPKAVFGDPFTHPKLPRIKPAVMNLAPPVDGEIGDTMPRPPGLSGDLKFKPLEPQLPDAINSGEKQPAAEAKLPTVCLQAVVWATSPVAFIAIGDKEPQDYHTGDTVAPGITISKISEGAVELRVLKAARTLHVGEKVQL